MAQHLNSWQTIFVLHLATTGSDFKSDKILKRCFPGKWVDPSLNPIVGRRVEVGGGGQGGREEGAAAVLSCLCISRRRVVHVDHVKLRIKWNFYRFLRRKMQTLGDKTSLSATCQCKYCYRLLRSSKWKWILFFFHPMLAKKVRLFHF